MATTLTRGATIYELTADERATMKRLTEAGLVVSIGEHKRERDRLKAINAELLEVVTIWMRFFDTMPKGQFWKISCDIGLMNDGFIKSRTAIAKAKEKA